jgi:hypothetical protein
MPFFKVIVEGSNLSIPSEQTESPIAGFFTSRVVWASNKLAAEAKAVRSVEKLWAEPAYVSQPSASKLVLAVSKSTPASIWQWLAAPNKGHTFFPAEDPRGA